MNYGELLSSFLVDLQSLYRKNISIEGASFPQILALSIIPDDGIEMSALSKKIGIDNSTSTRLIIGLEKKESDKILEKIYQHQARLDLTCRFRWTENAVAIWDNRSVQHYAISDFFPGRGLGHERIMDRIAIKGDRPN